MSAANSRRVVGSQLMAGLLVTCCLLVHSAAAQKPTTAKSSAAAAKAAPPAKSKKYVVVYRPKCEDGQVLIRILGQVIPEATFSFAGGSNIRLVVMASRTEHERVKALLQELDALSPQQDELKVFRLVNTEAKSMLAIISKIAGNGKVKFAVDPRTNNLLAAGPASELAKVEAILQRLDEMPDSEEDKTFCVRVVWFVEGAPGVDQLKSDSDLLAVQRELSKMGAAEIHPAGQTLVSVTSGGTFQISCPALFGDGSADLSIDGTLDLQQVTPHLAIQISAERAPAVQDPDAKPDSTERDQRVKLETKIVAPLGHYVVLGITPEREKTLAFAVQVRRLD